MLPQLYLNLCIKSWAFLAQAVPAAPAASGVPAGVAPGAPPALPGAVASGLPAAAPPTLPAAVASGLPAAAPPTLPGAGVPQMPMTVAPQVNTMVPPIEAQSSAHPVLHGLLLTVYFLTCIGLVGCVMFQTTKNEGLSGVIGGTVSSSVFRGKKSADEQLSQWTTRFAVLFIVLSLVLWLGWGRAARAI
ncbi:MAG: preprotein translocase subunit SecG [Proteobacteria bacterium]|nr:preprotein translocase subunit SecG [Pseudomonadota bacterium]